MGLERRSNTRVVARLFETFADFFHAHSLS